MGRKVNPKIFRTPLIRDWDSKWFAKKYKFRFLLKEDLQIRKFLEKKLKNCGVARINIERMANTIKVIIYTAKPGLIIGRGGVDIEKLKEEIKKFLSQDMILEVNVLEEKSPAISSMVVLEGAISELEKRIPFRRVMKKIIKQVQVGGAKGVKIIASGRLGGAEIARSEKLIWGSLPLQTLRAEIDYARGTAFTIYGTIGVKIWIYKGEKFNKEN
ncbi:MAG: 30S ribosomal protein S3 [Patescibacteria group bacterium]|jgi:small subunit ribosomal protein S3|nr:30S ribosomal protein S3 [Patescibacteria group bacterium]MDD5172917.1 30S ribosomal protein S3 [Patescibacteria group bacterium]